MYLTIFKKNMRCYQVAMHPEIISTFTLCNETANSNAANCQSFHYSNLV